MEAIIIPIRITGGHVCGFCQNVKTLFMIHDYDGFSCSSCCLYGGKIRAYGACHDAACFKLATYGHMCKKHVVCAEYSNYLNFLNRIPN